jgi:hypothetical protein
MNAGVYSSLVRVKKSAGACAASAPGPPTAASASGTSAMTATVRITNWSVSVMRTAHSPPAVVYRMTTAPITRMHVVSENGVATAIIFATGYNTAPVASTP